MKAIAVIFTTLALSVANLTGCATTGPGQNVFYGTGKTFRMNGALFSELQPDALGSGASRLTVKSSADAAALDELTIFYTRSALRALEKKDTELFAVNWYIAKKLAAARLEQLAASQAFKNALLANHNGSAKLASGGRVFLPRNLYDVPAKRAALDFDSEPAALAAATFDWSSAPKVAAVGDTLKGLLAGVAKGGNGNSQGGSYGSGERMTRDMADQMKVGSAYAVQDSLGNKFIIEKTDDGIVLHNPDSKPALIDLNQVNFMPILDRPSSNKVKAAKLVANMDRVFDDALAEASARHQNTFGVFNYNSMAPNIYVLGDRRAFIDANGNATTVDDPAVRNRYKSDPVFKYAIDLQSYDNLQNDQIYRQMKSNCQYMAWRNHYGDALEYVRYSCIRPDNTVTYSRTYVIGNDYTTQSWDSLAKDKRYRDALEQADKSARVVEALTAFLPLIGDVDAAMRCGDSSSLTYMLTNGYFNRNMNDDVRKAVRFVPEADNPSAVGKALDCAQGVGGLAGVRRGVTVGSKLLRWETLATSQAYKDTTAMMGLFDSRIHDASNIDKVFAEVKGFSSPDAAFVAKMFYDTVQTSNNIGSLAERVVKKIL
jgi:hypothetical protein